MSFIETSALDSSNVDTAFENVITDVYNILNNLQQQENAKKEATSKALKAGGLPAGTSKANTGEAPSTIKINSQTTGRADRQAKKCGCQ